MAWRQDVAVVNQTKRCERLPLSESTKRRLWSECAGYCQNPADGTFLFKEDTDVDFAEMAHIVPATTSGPRDVAGVTLTREERAHHSNIVVLCANCHTIVDKDPDNYPLQVLKQWKARHQETLRAAFGTPVFEDRAQARAYVEPRFAANRAIFRRYGPQDDEFSEERAAQWRRHALKTVVPNNAAIARVIKQNRMLLRPDEREAADEFMIHEAEFAARHVLNDWTAGSQTFPAGMDLLFEGPG